MNELLKGVTVLEAGASPAVRYCGRLCALNGAHVEVNRGEGSGPAALDDYLDADKVLTTSLSEGHDIVIADPNHRWNLVRSGITGTVHPFGSSDRRNWLAPEIVLASVGGAANYTRTPGGMPVYGFGRRFQYLAGEYLFVALVSLLGTTPPDPVEHPRVRVANDEVVTALLPYGTTQYAYNGTVTTVEQSGPRFLVECRDGFLCVYAGGAWSALALLLQGRVAEDDPRFVEFGARFANVDELDEIVSGWAAGCSVEEAVAAADAASVAVAPCYDLNAALGDSSLYENGVLRRTDVRGRNVSLAGLAYHVRETV